MGRMRAILVQGAILCLDAVDKTGGLQVLQLAVDSGQPNGAAGLTQIFRQFGGSQRFTGPDFQAAEDGLTLFGGVGHTGHSF